VSDTVENLRKAAFAIEEAGTCDFNPTAHVVMLRHAADELFELQEDRRLRVEVRDESNNPTLLPWSPAWFDKHCPSRAK